MILRLRWILYGLVCSGILQIISGRVWNYTTMIGVFLLIFIAGITPVIIPSPKARPFLVLAGTLPAILVLIIARHLYNNEVVLRNLDWTVSTVAWFMLIPCFIALLRGRKK